MSPNMMSITSLLPCLADEDLDQLHGAVQLLINKRPGRKDPYRAGVTDTLMGLRQMVDEVIKDGEFDRSQIVPMLALIEAAEEDLGEGMQQEEQLGLPQSPEVDVDVLARIFGGRRRPSRHQLKTAFTWLTLEGEPSDAPDLG